MERGHGRRAWGGWRGLLVAALAVLAAGAGISGMGGEPEPGTGWLQSGGQQYTFRVVACELEPRRSSSGYVWEVWLLGEGEHRGRKFFVELERGRRNGEGQASLRLLWMALPAGWYHGAPPEGRTGVEDGIRARTADGLEATGALGLLSEQVVAEGGRVRVTGPVRLLRLKGGRADAFVEPGALEALCGH